MAQASGSGQDDDVEQSKESKTRNDYAADIIMRGLNKEGWKLVITGMLFFSFIFSWVLGLGFDFVMCSPNKEAGSWSSPVCSSSAAAVSMLSTVMTMLTTCFQKSSLGTMVPFARLYFAWPMLPYCCVLAYMLLQLHIVISGYGLTVCLKFL